jgi:hypothetical protein
VGGVCSVRASLAGLPCLARRQRSRGGHRRRFGVERTEPAAHEAAGAGVAVSAVIVARSLVRLLGRCSVSPPPRPLKASGVAIFATGFRPRQRREGGEGSLRLHSCRCLHRRRHRFGERRGRILYTYIVLCRYMGPATASVDLGGRGKEGVVAARLVDSPPSGSRRRRRQRRLCTSGSADAVSLGRRGPHRLDASLFPFRFRQRGRLRRLRSRRRLLVQVQVVWRDTTTMTATSSTMPHRQRSLSLVRLQTSDSFVMLLYSQREERGE